MKIAIVRLSALGDIVFSAVCPALIKQKYKNAHITWIVDSRFEGVIADSPFVDEVVAISLKPLTLQNIAAGYKKLKNLGDFDIVLDLQGLVKSGLVAAALRSNTKVGYSYKSAREGVASCFYTKKVVSNYQKNIVLRYIDLLNTAFDGGFDGQEVYGKPPILGFRAKPKKSEKGRILVNMTASKQNKIYPWELMREALKEFDGYEIVVMGGEGDTVGFLGLDEVKGLISTCNLVVGGDTGITHLAWAMNIPSVTIFGATPSKRNTFETEKNITVSALSDVDAKKLDYDDFAIKAIPPKEIADAMRRVLC